MNTLKKATLLLLISMFIITGCNFGKNAENVTSDSEEVTAQQNRDVGETQDEENGIEEENTDDNKEALPAEDEEVYFEIEQSGKIEGWQQLILKDQSFTTADWESFTFEEDAPMVTYAIDFPQDWEIEFSVFYNEKQEKVAELFPAIYMKPGQKLLDTWENHEESEVLSKKEIKVDDLQGFKIISKVYPSGENISEWYSYTYYLTDGAQVFAINFYDVDQDNNEKLFDKIVKTFEFR